MLAADTDLESGLVCSAKLGAHRDEFADAVLIEHLKGISGQDAAIDIERQEAPASSRLRPKVVWVRSLVPKEKKSASAAISSAMRAARGNSIIVPIV